MCRRDAASDATDNKPNVLSRIRTLVNRGN
jgi:hypothetical protein